MPYFINDFAFDYKRESTYGKLILNKYYLILSDYGINYLKEGLQLLSELINAENKKLELDEDGNKYEIEYTKGTLLSAYA